MHEQPQHIHFVTGRLAEHAVRAIVERESQRGGFEFTVGVLPITVAALMTSKWLLRHLEIPPRTTRVLLPGYLQADIEEIRQHFDVPIDCGPRDIRDLPEFFGGKATRDEDYGAYSIEIIAEINHAPRLSREDLLRQARSLQQRGADRIDLGCSPGRRWTDVADAVRAIGDLGMRVSIDSFDEVEVANACSAGADLVLSVNSSNRHAAVEWGAEVVVIPDAPSDEKSFQESINFLSQRDVPMRLDPILEPLGCGFIASLSRYAACRRDYPEAKMMMGIGNITELTDADSAGINVLLLGICQELRIESVLTTEVINWARNSVRECDLARRMMHFACKHGIPPKHLEPDLVQLRDAKVRQFELATIVELSQSIRDKNIRIMNADGEIHAVSAGVHAHDADPFVCMQALLDSPVGDSIDASHAFYLGFEMAKAMTANTLSKQYEQDQPLNWGMLTQPERHHRLPRGRKAGKPSSDS